jgi:hypothetical protein
LKALKTPNKRLAANQALTRSYQEGANPFTMVPQVGRRCPGLRILANLRRILAQIEAIHLLKNNNEAKYRQIRENLNKKNLRSALS